MSYIDNLNLEKLQPEVNQFHKPEFKRYLVSSYGNEIVLPEIPSDEYRVRLYCDDIELSEVKDIQLLTDKNFYVNYPNGRIYVGKDYSNKAFKIDGYWIGFSLCSASRIVYKLENNILKTLDDIISGYGNIISGIELVGDYASFILKADSLNKEVSDLFKQIDERYNTLTSTDNDYFEIKEEDYVNNTSLSIPYKYYATILHNKNSLNVQAEFFGSDGFKLDDVNGDFKWKTQNLNEIRVYSNIKKAMVGNLVFRYYNGLNSTNYVTITDLRQDIEWACVDAPDDIIYTNLAERLDAMSTKTKNADKNIQTLKTEYEEFRNIINGTVLFAPNYGVLPDLKISISPMLQKMANIAKTLGGATIIIPKGKYYVDKRFEMFSNTTLIMCSGCEIYKKNFGNGTHGDFFKAGISQTQKGYGVVKNIKIYGGKLIGNPDIEPTNEGGMSIGLHHCSNVLISGVHFYLANFYGHCIDLPADDNVIIEKCIFEGHDHSKYTDRGYTEAIQCDSSYYGCFGTMSMAFDGLASKNITVKNCKFIPILNDNGTIKYPAPYPIGCHTFVKGNRYKNIIFENNYVQDCTERIEDHYGAWLRFYAVQDLKIMGNTFEMTNTVVNPSVISVQNKLGGKDVGGNDLNVGLSSYDILIENNTFTGFKYENGGRRNSLILLYGLELDTDGKSHVNSRNAKIINNTFRDCLPIVTDNYNVGVCCIRTDWFDDILIDGNICDGISQFVNMPDVNNTYQGEYSAKNVIITNNIVRKCLKAPLSINSTQNTTIKDNIFRDCGMGNVFNFRYNNVFDFTNNTLNCSYIYSTQFAEGTYLFKLYDTDFFVVGSNKLIMNNSNFGTDGVILYIASNCSKGSVTGNISNSTTFPSAKITSSCKNVVAGLNYPTEANNAAN